MSRWPYIVVLLATRCLYWWVHLLLNFISLKCHTDLMHDCKCQADLMLYCFWPPDVSTGGMSALHLLKIWALEHWAMYVDCSVLLLLLLFHVFVVIVCLSLCIHNYRWTTTKLHSKQQQQQKRSIYINCSIFLFWLFMLLLCNFVVVLVHL